MPQQLLGDATALAWATSGGDDHYRDTFGAPPTIDLRGLWGIDLVEWSTYGFRDLFDPRQNARIAVALTGDEDGTLDWSPVWRAGVDRQLRDDCAAIVASGQRTDTLRETVGSNVIRTRVAGTLANLRAHSRAMLQGPIRQEGDS
jgi:hypothetical protein